jgi:hypothetical protein
MATLLFALALFGLFALSFAVMVVGFTIVIHGASWRWPVWVRYGALFAIFVGYCAWVLSHQDGLTGYRLAAIAAAVAIYRVARGFSRTFLPSFVAAFKAALDKPRH